MGLQTGRDQPVFPWRRRLPAAEALLPRGANPGCRHRPPRGNSRAVPLTWQEPPDRASRLVPNVTVHLVRPIAGAACSNSPFYRVLPGEQDLGKSGVISVVDFIVTREFYLVDFRTCRGYRASSASSRGGNEARDTRLRSILDAIPPKSCADGVSGSALINSSIDSPCPGYV
jgi:hypothetical protein